MHGGEVGVRDGAGGGFDGGHLLVGEHAAASAVSALGAGVGQALADEPTLLLCDEPLSSLDLRHQQEVTRLIDNARRTRNLGVLFVTHEINPVLPYVDRVVYVAGGKVRVGTPDAVLRSDVLSELYGSHVEVFHRGDRIIVLANEERSPHLHAPEISNESEEMG